MEIARGSVCGRDLRLCECRREGERGRRGGVGRERGRVGEGERGRRGGGEDLRKGGVRKREEVMLTRKVQGFNMKGEREGATEGKERMR